jgi:Nucleotidyl transferase AbiEii toxin, Type IV TA system
VGAQGWYGTACASPNPRHTRDIDLLRRTGTVQAAVDELRAAVERDLGDHFRFELGAATAHTDRPGQPETDQAKLPVDAFVGTILFERFPIDVVVGSVITMTPESVSPSIVVEFDGLVPPTYQLYPVVDHVADKLCATFERHGDSGKPSSRSRDLIDLVVLGRTQTLDAAMLKAAIEAERLHRGLSRIEAFAAPPEWGPAYSTGSKTVAECDGYRRLDDAVAFVGRFLDPVLSGDQPRGTWSPGHLSWS